MSILIGINGKMYAGKNTLSDAISAARPELGIQITGWADRLKEAALALDPWIPLADRPEWRGNGIWRLSVLVDEFGWDEVKKHPEVRRFLQILGTEAGRDIHGEDCWVEAWTRVHPNWSFENHIIADTRFANEAQAIIRRGGIIIRITRPELDVATPAKEHRSEAGIPDELITIHVNNTGNLRALQDVGARIGASLR